MSRSSELFLEMREAEFTDSLDDEYQYFQWLTTQEEMEEELIILNENKDGNKQSGIF